MSDEPVTIMYVGGHVINNRRLCGRLDAGPPPTTMEWIKWKAKTGAVWCGVALIIFAGSYAATKDPEAFARGFVSGYIGYLIVRGAAR